MNDLRALLADPRRRPIVLAVAGLVAALALWQRRAGQGSSSGGDAAAPTTDTRPVLADPTVPTDPGYIDAEEARNAALQAIGASALLGQWNVGTGLLGGSPAPATPTPTPAAPIETITPPNSMPTVVQSPARLIPVSPIVRNSGLVALPSPVSASASPERATALVAAAGYAPPADPRGTVAAILRGQTTRVVR